MALQSSGAISLNDIHVEAGGTSGTQASINDADIRGLIGKASGATMSFSEWYGASSSLDTQTVTVGQTNLFGNVYSGYLSNFSLGSISDGTSNLYSGLAIAGIYHRSQGSVLFFQFNQGSVANSGWSNMIIDQISYARTSATYTSTSSQTYWQWSVGTNPFGSSGTKVVTWT